MLDDMGNFAVPRRRPVNFPAPASTACWRNVYERFKVLTLRFRLIIEEKLQPHSPVLLLPQNYA